MLLKIIVDILMFVCMILEFSRGYMQPIYHEIIGIVLLILVFIHLWLNRGFFLMLFKGKYSLVRWMMSVVNIGFFISFFLTIVFGILSSQNLLKFANIHSMSLIELHKVFGYLTLIFMAIHLGMHVYGGLMKLEKRMNKRLLYFIELLVVGYGVYAFVTLDIWNHLIGRYGFGLVEGNIVINCFNYVAVVLMICLITSFCYRLVLKMK